ncbi:MAG: hypothetical protein C0497_06515 [Gemmatimonas sp.]|nr:hypothetical protein [Gemmatimonas sp.]
MGHEAPAACDVYKPLRPQASPLFRLVSNHVQRLQTVPDERFAREYGPCCTGKSSWRSRSGSACAVWVPEDDRVFATRLARYCARNPVALERLTDDRAAGSGGYTAPRPPSALLRRGQSRAILSPPRLKLLS